MHSVIQNLEVKICVV